MRRVTAVVMVVSIGGAVLLSACGGESTSSSEKFCARAEDADVSGDEVDTAMESGDAKEIERSVNDALDAAEATLRQAPDGIKSEMETVVAKQREFVDMLDGVDFDMAALDAETLAEFVDDSDFDDAGEKIDEFLLDECGIEPDPTDAPAADGAGTSTDDTTEFSIAASALIPDYETFVEFAMIGSGRTISDEDKACVVAGLADKISLEELQSFVDTSADQMSEEQSMAVGLAFINCGVDFG